MSETAVENENTQKTKVDLPRVLYTILYLIIGRFIAMIIFVIVVMQFIYTWFSDGPNENILSFSDKLAEYSKEIIRYVGLNSDEKPWPLGKWPTGTQKSSV
jgi:hypothetical protein